jgi:hypothetical protein
MGMLSEEKLQVVGLGELMSRAERIESWCITPQPSRGRERRRVVRFMLSSTLTLAILLPGCAVLHAQTAVKPSEEKSAPRLKFRIAEHDLYPESIVYDPVSKDYFLSSMGQRRILRIHPDGSYEDFLAAEVPELASSIGMKVDAERRALWVCTGRFSLLAASAEVPPRTGVLRFDLDSGKLLQSWILDEEQQSPYHIFNDLALNADGVAFATTTLLGRLYRITPGVDELVLVDQLEEGSHNNGITFGPDDKYLFVTVDRRIERIDLATGKRAPLAVPDEAALGTDGLYYHDRSLILVRPRFKSIVRLFLDDDLLTVHRVEILVEDHPDLAYPTTGMINGNTLVYVATSFADTPRNEKAGPQHPDVLIHEISLGSD